MSPARSFRSMAATALPRSELSADPAALGRFLAEASGANSVEISALELLPGGAIQENWGFAAVFAGGRFGGAQHLVLRTDAATGIPSSLGRIEEFAVLQAAFAAGVKVPEPLFACVDPSVFGKPFFVMRRVRRPPPRPGLPPDPGRRSRCAQGAPPPRP